MGNVEEPAAARARSRAACGRGERQSKSERAYAHGQHDVKDHSLSTQ